MFILKDCYYYTYCVINNDCHKSISLQNLKISVYRRTVDSHIHIPLEIIPPCYLKQKEQHSILGNGWRWPRQSGRGSCRQYRRWSWYQHRQWWREQDICTWYWASHPWTEHPGGDSLMSNLRSLNFESYWSLWIVNFFSHWRGPWLMNQLQDVDDWRCKTKQPLTGLPHGHKTGVVWSLYCHYFITAMLLSLSLVTFCYLWKVEWYWSWNPAGVCFYWFIWLSDWV